MFEARLFLVSEVCALTLCSGLLFVVACIAILMPIRIVSFNSTFMYDVILRVYDVSQGVARRWSRLVLGEFLEAVYHTGVLYRGREYYYCGSIQRSRPEEVTKIYALDFLRSVHLGRSEMAVRDLENMLHSKRHLYTPETYDIAKWNCNHFSDRAVRYLMGRGEIGVLSSHRDPFKIHQPDRTDLQKSYWKAGGLVCEEDERPGRPSERYSGGHRDSGPVLQRRPYGE